MVVTHFVVLWFVVNQRSVEIWYGDYIVSIPVHYEMLIVIQQLQTCV